MDPAAYTPKRVISIYVWTSALFTLATSMIWAINTIFLLQRGHLTIFQFTLVNTAFLIGQAIFEVPTGVIADTIGRKAAFLLSIVTIAISTVIYVVTPLLGWGVWGFTIASLQLGLGFTFQNGTVDAWMVDALDATGHTGPKDIAFARGQQAESAAMILGSLGGGLLGYIDLVIPYLVRAGILVAAFVLVMLTVHDVGFTPRPLKWSTIGDEANRVFRSGTAYGWHNPVVRPMMFVSAVAGIAGMFVFYSWQPLVLAYLGDPRAVWLLGVVQAAGSAMGIVGAALVGRFAGTAENRRGRAMVLALSSVASASIVLGIALVGLTHVPAGVVAAGIAIGLWLGWNLLFGLVMPLRSSYLNTFIPSQQRATVLSLDAVFADAGGTIGQPILGWIATATTLPIAWAISSGAIVLGAPLYAIAGRAAEAWERPQET